MSKGRRWLLRAVAWLLGFAALLVAVALTCLHGLDRPWLKQRLEQLVQSSTGIEIDYRAVRVAVFSGLAIDGLVVRSPLGLRAFAPELLRVGRIEASWTLASLLRGQGPWLARLKVSDVALSVVEDEQGKTSFDALAGRSSAPAPSPSVPLSQQASRLLAGAPPVNGVVIERVALTWTKINAGKPAERTELRGISLALEARPETARGFFVNAGLGSAEAPLQLSLMRSRPGAPTAAARALLTLALSAKADAATAALDLVLLEQSFAKSGSSQHRVSAEARARFDRGAARSELTLVRLAADDGAASADASIELPDTGEPIVRHARGEIDLARVLGWLPAGLVPLTAERARAHLEIEALRLGPSVQLSEGAAVAIDAEVSNIAVVAGPPLRVGEGRFTLHAQPAARGGIAGRGTLKLAGVQLDWGEGALSADDLAVDVEGERAADAKLSGRVAIHFGQLERSGRESIAARGGEIELRANGLALTLQAPIATRGDLSASVAVTALELRASSARAKLDKLAVRAHAPLEGRPPYAVELDARAARLRLNDRDGKLLANAPCRIETRMRELAPDLAEPVASRGVIHAAVELGQLGASLDATKRADTLDFALRASAGSLKAARPFLEPSLLDAAPWDRIAVALKSNGRIDRIGTRDPALRAVTELDVERAAFRQVAARSLVLKLSSQGTALRHELDADLRTVGLAIGGDAASDDHVTLFAAVDRERRSLEWKLAAEGRARIKLAGSLGFEASRRALHYALDAELAGLAPLAPLLAKLQGLDAFDLSRLELELSARGTLSGVLNALGNDGRVELAESPARTASIEGSTRLRVAHLRWTKHSTAVLAPALEWHGDMHGSEQARNLDSRLEIGTLHLDLGDRDVDLNGVRDDARITVRGNLADPEIELSQQLAIRALEQTFLPEYPSGDLALALTAERSPEGVIHISDLKLKNGLGGTALALNGNLDLGEGRRTLSVTTSLEQDLGRLSTIPERMKGRGKLAVEANVTSPDLALFRVRAALKGENVSLAIPRAGIELEKANGEVPVAVTLELGARGVRFERSESRNPYSMLRFADQHPLLSRSGFLSIARLKTPFVTIAPLVGNLGIEQNAVSLRQFEMGVRGGSITGQCGLDWQGPKSTLELHVRANGVQSSHGEPFDGNIAVVISAADRTIDGRAEILRIGERHLLDLLDLQDPLHVDAAMNRIRTALGFGYPKNLRLLFDHGFASARLELGGLAQFVSISELRGIPMGPIVDKMLAPVLEGPEMKEMP